MATVKSLADGHTKLAVLATAPADPDAVTLAELTSALDASCRIAKNGYALGPTASETFADPALCEDVNSSVWGASNFESTIPVFRYFDDTTNLVDEEGDEVYQALKEKGTEVWLVERESLKKSTDPWEAGDVVNVYRALLDNPQKASDRTGYIKNTIAPAIQEGHLDVTVAGAGV
jgi:hypothetical protein